MRRVVSPGIFFLLLTAQAIGQGSANLSDLDGPDDFAFRLGNNHSVETEIIFSGDRDQARIKFIPGQQPPVTSNSTLSLTCDECTPILKQGAPDLSQLTASLIVPGAEELEARVVRAEYEEFFNVYVFPSKGNLSRQQNPAEISATEGIEYSQNEFWPASIVSVRSPYIFRDYRGQTLEVVPFQYNPVTKVLRIYSLVEVEVFGSGRVGANAMNKNTETVSVQNEFHDAYRRSFLNYGEGLPYYPVLNDDRGRMLVISHGDFADELAPFVEWKRQKGIPVDVVDVATIGNASQIKTYVEGYYNTFGLTYLLLVGDAAQVPTYPGVFGDSDNQYAFILGEDFYPEIFVGRFSAENENEVLVQVNRSLMYEKNPLATGSWASSGLCVGSDQGPGDDNEYDFEHERNIREQLLGFTYTHVHELYDGSQGGMDSPGDPNPQMMFDIVQEGIGIINYTGHGSDFSCSTTGFSVTEVNNLSNFGMWPFFISVACVNGNFAGNTCFAEAWLRAGSANPSQPFGAVATLMSTINQSWSPPMEGQDEMNSILTGNSPSNVHHTFGGITMNGCMKMNDSYGVNGYDMTETWTLFGDPSLVVRTAMPSEMNVSHAPSLNQWSEIFVVDCDVEGAMVSLTLNGEILATGIVSAGQVQLDFDPLAMVDTLLVTVTAFNKFPYQGPVLIVPSTEMPDPTSDQLSVSPNPFSHEFRVLIQPGMKGDLKLVNAIGQVVFCCGVNEAGEVLVGSKELPSGIYTLIFSSGELVFTRKMVCNR